MKISTQIDQLITEYIVGIISEDDKLLLEQKLAEDPMLMAYYEQKKAVIGTPHTNPQLYQPTNFREQSILNKKATPRSYIPWAAAIAAMVVMVVGAYLWLQSDEKTSTSSTAVKSVELVLADGQRVNLSDVDTSGSLKGKSFQTQQKTLSYSTAGKPNYEQVSLVVPAGKDYTIILSDGSKIHLNAASRMHFPFTFQGNFREVQLEGEAYFEVAKDPKHPFIIHTPHQSVRVLGTAFNVNCYDPGKEVVALLHGSVMVSADSDTVRLSPGLASTTDEKGEIKTATFDSTDLLSWRQGIYEFYNTPLEKVMKNVPRLYGDSVIITNAIAAQKRISGYMDRNKPLNLFLEQLKATNAIQYTRKEGVYYLR
ncbi:FecR family protein [Chitinophaga sp. S165]|uniref:FecR family protein n=1 Tax=Chitinophaga sp. S165 TaxID=2135462 RepID=UPI000D717AAE|nr:FecR domain-containing protein [Chitinophaga sp. S165]PWV47099.1 FecR family protein [Chitinophaga sp. S165]